MSDPNPPAEFPYRLFLAHDVAQPERICVSGLEIVVYSQPSPAKETSNEDGGAVIPVSADAAVLAIADGVGGARGGELASMAALQALANHVSHERTTPEALRAAILDGLEAANVAVCGLKIGAATTMAAVEFCQGTIRPYHVGDSAILVIGQRGRVRYQTVYHSPVGFAVEAGFLAEKSAIFHEDNHLVSNVVGDPHMRIEVGPSLTLAARDTVLIASDGLFDNLWIEEIVAEIRKGKLTQCVARLAAAARSRMETYDNLPTKPDDLTMIAFRRLPESKPGQHPTIGSNDPP